MKTRLEYNRLIVKGITEAVEKHPDLRFGQLLFAMGMLEQVKDSTHLHDIFNDESYDTYATLHYHLLTKGVK
jgi:hypothetical protein